MGTHSQTTSHAFIKRIKCIHAILSCNTLQTPEVDRAPFRFVQTKVQRKGERGSRGEIMAQIGEHRIGFDILQAWVCIPSSTTYWMADTGNFLNLPEPWFPHPFNGVNDTYSHDFGERQIKFCTKSTPFSAEYTMGSRGKVSLLQFRICIY